MRALLGPLACGVCITAAMLACAGGSEVAPFDTPVSDDPGRLLPVTDASSDLAPPRSDSDTNKKADVGKSDADAATTAPSGAIIAAGTEQGEVVGSVVLAISATVEGRIDDDDWCPSTDPWVEGSFPFATVAIHNPLSAPIEVDVSAETPGVSVVAYGGTNVPMTMAARRGCEVNSYAGHLGDTVSLEAYESKLLFVTSAAPLGPNVTTGAVPLRLTTFL